MAVTISKAARLLTILPSNPLEFVDRVGAVLQVRLGRPMPVPEYESISLAKGIQLLKQVFGEKVLGFEEEAGAFQKRMEGAIAALPSNAPFQTHHNGDFVLATLCFIVCRCLQPDVVVETGVCYGVTSAFVLHALSLNQKGHLYSIDLPPLGAQADRFVGILVPADLRDRWTLTRGASRRKLLPLLSSLTKLDVFVHDSLHTYVNMKWEFETAFAHLARPGAVIADDIGLNHSFAEHCQLHPPNVTLIVQQNEKSSPAGLSLHLA